MKRPRRIYVKPRPDEVVIRYGRSHERRGADAAGRPRVDLLNVEEEARVRVLIEARTWPEKWSGDEPRADVPLDRVFGDGSVQPLLGLEDDEEAD